MRIPYPKRFPLQPAMGCALALMMVQIAEGTNPVFAVLVFGTIMAWVLSFNVLGGLDRVSGMLVFGQGALGFVTPELVKALLREPADTRLAVPILTVTVYFVGQCVILTVSFFVANIRPTRALLDSSTDRFQMREMAVGAAVLGFGSILLLTAFSKYSSTSGGWATALVQLMVYVLPFALALSIIAEIEDSGGKRTVNFLTVLITVYLLYNGFTHSVKEALMTPIAVYVVCCAAMRYDFKPIKMMTLSIILGFTAFYVIPLVQSYHATTQAQEGLTFDQTVNEIENASENVQEYKQTRENSIKSENGGEYFGTSVGLFDRYSLIALDAELIQTVENGDYMGYLGIYEGVINWIPHFLLPDKPQTFTSETYAHRLPGANLDDMTTGISFGAIGTTFAMGGWTALFILLPLVQGFFMLEMDVMLPSVTNTPWMVCLLADMLHVGPEANIDIMTSLTVQTPLRIAFVILVVRHGVRMFSSVFGGSQRGQQLQQFLESKARIQERLSADT